MEEYNIYAGLANPYGGMQYHSTVKAHSEEEAEEYAAECAYDIYDSYAGYNSDFPTWEEVANRLGFDDPDCLDVEDEERVDEQFMEIVNNWIISKAILTSEDTIPEDELVREHDLC